MDAEYVKSNKILYVKIYDQSFCSAYHLCLLELPSEVGIMGSGIIIIDQDLQAFDCDWCTCAVEC